MSAAVRWLRQADGLGVVALIVSLLTLFGLVHNPWWVPTGDSEVFLVTARNFYNGDGLTFLGDPLRVAPPGWPIVLAFLMWLGGGLIAVLKLAQIVFMIGGLLLMYFVLRGGLDASPRQAVLATLLAAVCSPLYPLTFWLHSDALFMLLAGGATLAAVRFGRGEAVAWLVAAVVLVALGIVVRWAGFVFAPVVALACLSGRQRRGIVGMCVVGLASLIWFAFLYGIVTRDAAVTALAVADAPDLLIRERPDLSLVGELLDRLTRLPNWVGWTFFAPMRFLAFGTHDMGQFINTFVGTLATSLIIVAAVLDVRRGRWLMAGVLTYIIALAVIWPFPNPRYLVPVLPLAIFAITTSLSRLATWKVGPLWRTLRWSFVAALLAVNGSMWLVDVWVARASTPRDFYNRYEAGIHLSLLESAWRLRNVDGNVAYSGRYENLNELWVYHHPRRVIAYLAGRDALQAPMINNGRRVKAAQQWSRDNDISWYVHQNPTVPGRVWHFRLTPEEHGLVMGDPSHSLIEQFELYEMRNHAKPGHPVMLWLDAAVPPPLTDEEIQVIACRVPDLGT